MSDMHIIHTYPHMHRLNTSITLSVSNGENIKLNQKDKTFNFYVINEGFHSEMLWNEL